MLINNKISCIKTVREHTGLGLLDAKGLVDEIERMIDPDLGSNFVVVEAVQKFGSLEEAEQYGKGDDPESLRSFYVVRTASPITKYSPQTRWEVENV
jgi:hypothetical protein